MKRIFVLVICAILAMCFVSCAKQQPQNQPQNSPVAQLPEEFDETQPQLDIRISDSLDKAQLSDGTVLYDVNIQKVNSYVLQYGEFMPCSKAINAMIDKVAVARQSSAEDFKGELNNIVTTSGVEQAGIPWSMTALYNVEKNDARAVSISEKVEELRGALANGNVSATFGYNFDARTGKMLSLKEACANDTQRQTFETLINTKLVNKYGAETFEGYEKLGTLVEIGDDSWYFTPDGIVVFYNVSEIAPAIAGGFEISISKDELPAGLIKYFF